jgi:hypothetical protein
LDDVARPPECTRDLRVFQPTLRLDLDHREAMVIVLDHVVGHVASLNTVSIGDQLERLRCDPNRPMVEVLEEKRRELEATLVPDEAFRGGAPVAPWVMPLSPMPAERPPRLGLEDVSSLEIRELAPLEVIPVESQRVLRRRCWRQLLRVANNES